jgi:hypothetical protein
MIRRGLRIGGRKIIRHPRDLNNVAKELQLVLLEKVSTFYRYGVESTSRQAEGRSASLNPIS